MNNYILKLLSNGDIFIIKCSIAYDYQIVYHKTYNPSDNIKDNLDNAYKEWEKLTQKEIKGE